MAGLTDSTVLSEYIALLDTRNSYALVKELQVAPNLPGATSLSHVSLAGEAFGVDLTETQKKVDNLKEPLASAYAGTRGTFLAITL